MPDVAVHFDIADKLQYACRWLRKAHAAEKTVWICTSLEDQHELNALLWTFAPNEFIPHCLANQSESLKAKSPIVIGTSINTNNSSSSYALLLYLRTEPPQGVDHFERIIDIVGQTETDKQAGRDRWQYYKAQGWNLTAYRQGNPS